MRDYSTPKDLLALIRCVWKKNTINDFFDVYSKKPVSKFEILQFLAKKYDLVYEIEELAKGTSRVSSSKKSYFSKSRKAEKLLGYAPELSSLEGIEVEISKMNL